MPKKPSKFWAFFRKIDRNTAECRLCGKHLRTCGNTTNLGKHIKRHPNYRELANQSGDSEDEKPIKSGKSWESSSSPLKDDSDGYAMDGDYAENVTEEIYLDEDPLLQQETVRPEIKLSIKEVKNVQNNHSSSSQAEERVFIPGNSTKRMRPTSSTTAPLPSSTSHPLNLQAVHLSFAEFFFACNIPFKALNSVHMKRFVSKLNGTYRPPSMRELTTTYLDRVYDKYSTPKKSEEQESILLLSGWKDFTTAAKCIVACLYLRGDTESRVYLNTWDLSIDVYPDGEDIQKRIFEESLKLASENYNAKIYSVISDSLTFNTADCGVLWWQTVCHSYLAGCLAQDIVNKQDTKLVKQILQQFEARDIEDQIVERGGVRVVLPWDDRWCTFRDSFQCYVKNNQNFRDILTESKHSIESYLSDAIFNDGFMTKITNYVSVLEPLCKLIYLAQRKKATLAEVVEEWMQLHFPAEYQAHLQHRRLTALTPFALAANFMHPVYRGKSISDSQMESVEFFFLENLNSKGLDDMFLFKKNEGIFQILAEKEIVTCNTYWSMAGRKHPELSALAKKLLNIPASVSFIDKLFSNWSTTHHSARNLLGMEVYRKLTKTHFLLNLADTS